jgi:membrane-anchored glycerophosphoryl diester phosphodiesterase (GDPDase)
MVTKAMLGGKMTDNGNKTKNNEQRIQSFARFFKGYMGTAPMIAAALPIPVTAGKIIPTYAEHTAYMTTYTSMFCFLIVALIFYRRHRLGSYLLPENWDKKSRLTGRFMISWLPFTLILITLVSIGIYHITLNSSISLHPNHETLKMSEVLKTASTRKLSYCIQAILMLSYFGIFIASTAAFALMAVREYMQDVLKLSEIDLVTRVADPFKEKGRDFMANKANSAQAKSGTAD